MTAEKRPLDQEKLTFQNISSIIVDIEGTTTSISFVHDTLFPYVREHLNEYVKSNWTDSEFQEDLKALKEQAEKDVSDKMEGVVAIAESEDEEVVREAVIKNVLWQMDNDRKTAALKQLQGHIWRKAYEKGQVVGHIYDDVHESLKSWVDTGIKVYVYSSGSVEAQKLLFGHTKEGDLLELFSGHFDTAVGAKTEAASYTKIMEQIEPDGGSDGFIKFVLFLTDVPKEAAAAKEAGMLAVLVAREGNAALTDDAKAAFKVINSFADLSFEGNCKRRKVSESDANTNSAVNVDMKESQDVDMKEAQDESTEQKTGDSTKDENDSAETKMDTSEAVDTEAKDQVCARKPEAVNTEVKDQVCARKPEVVDTEANDQVCSRKPEAVDTEAKDQVCARKPEAVDTEVKDQVCARKSEAVDTEAKDQACAREPVEATEEKSEAVSEKSNDVEADKEQTNETASSDTIKSEENSKNSDKIEEPKDSAEKAEVKDENVTDESKKIDENTVEKTENDKVETNDEKPTENTTTEEQVSASDEKASKDVTENGSALEASVEKEKVDTPDDKSAKQEVSENVEMNDDSGIADINKSVNQSTSEKSDDAKADDNLANGKPEETAAKEGEVEAKANGEKDETEKKETTNGKLEETESSDHLKNGESKVNGSEAVVEKKVVETNGCVKPAVVGDEVKEKLNGEKHDETDKPKTDKANGNQIAVDENNKAETVTV